MCRIWNPGTQVPNNKNSQQKGPLRVIQFLMFSGIKKGILIKLRNAWTRVGLKHYDAKTAAKERKILYLEYSINNIWIESVASEMCRRPGREGGGGGGGEREYNTIYTSNHVCKLSPHFMLQNSGIPESRDVPNGTSALSFRPCLSHRRYGLGT